MGNVQASYYFLSLQTDNIVVRNNWTVLPMPAEVISTVHQHAAACKKYEGITFTDKDGNITNNDNDPDSVEDEESANPEITGVDITGVDTTGVDIAGVDITGAPTEQQDENYEHNMDDDDYTNSENIEGNTDGNTNNTETENKEASNTPSTYQ